MNDVPSLHEIVRLTSDVEYAERMERFRAELVISSGTCLWCQINFYSLISWLRLHVPSLIYTSLEFPARLIVDLLFQAVYMAETATNSSITST